MARWTDNGDGTVTDTATKLVWLKDARAFGEMSWKNAMVKTGNLKSGEAGLTDGSKQGDWRLPTEKELQGLTIGSDDVMSAKMRTLTGIQSDYYWSSTDDNADPDARSFVKLKEGVSYYTSMVNEHLVWPVRSGK